MNVHTTLTHTSYFVPVSVSIIRNTQAPKRRRLHLNETVSLLGVPLEIVGDVEYAFEDLFVGQFFPQLLVGEILIVPLSRSLVELRFVVVFVLWRFLGRLTAVILIVVGTILSARRAGLLLLLLFIVLHSYNE